MIWESFLEKTVDSDVLKKYINTPQFARLERRAETRDGEAKVETKKQQNIAANENIEAKKAPTDTEKATLETEEAKYYAEEAQHSAEDAKVILFETKKDYEEARPKFKHEAEQDMDILKKHKESAL